MILLRLCDTARRSRDMEGRNTGLPIFFFVSLFGRVSAMALNTEDGFTITSPRLKVRVPGVEKRFSLLKI